MSVTDELLENSALYADSFDRGDLPLPPAKASRSSPASMPDRGVVIAPGRVTRVSTPRRKLAVADAALEVGENNCASDWHALARAEQG